MESGATILLGGDRHFDETIKTFCSILLKSFSEEEFPV